MTRSQALPVAGFASPFARASRSSLSFSRARLGVAAGVVGLVLASCGGGDDTPTTNPATLPEVTSAPPASTQITVPEITLPEVTTPVSVTYVTEGASVLVSNASRVDGAAGRLSDRLTAVGFSMVAPANYVPGQLDVTKIYFDAANTSAEAVANSLKAAFGGGAIEVLPLPAPPPIDSADMATASVLVAMGNDIADKTLDEMQGIAPVESSGDDGSSSDDSSASSGDSSSGDSSTGE